MSIHQELHALIDQLADDELERVRIGEERFKRGVYISLDECRRKQSG